MERFDFKLQKVLDYRISIEDEKKEEYVEAQKNVLKEENLLTYFQNQKRKAMESVSELKTCPELQAYSRYNEFMDKKILSQKDAIIRAKTIFEEKKEELLKSISDRKVLEKLKERAKEEYDFESLRKEQKFIDDLSIMSYLRHERG